MQQHKDVVKIRNQIMKVRTGTIQGDEAKLWDALEAVFRQSTPGNLKFTYALWLKIETYKPKLVIEPAVVIGTPVVTSGPEKKKFLRLKPKELHFLMSDINVAAKIKKDPEVWKKVRKPLTLGKLMQAALGLCLFDYNLS